MPWFPLADAELAFDFTADNAVLNGSVVAVEGFSGSDSVWAVSFPGAASPVRVRVTTDPFAADNSGEDAQFEYEGEDDTVYVDNESPNPNDAFSPSPVEMLVHSITDGDPVLNFNGGPDDLEAEFLIEVFIPGAECFWQQAAGLTQNCDPEA